MKNQTIDYNALLTSTLQERAKAIYKKKKLPSDFLPSATNSNIFKELGFWLLVEIATLNQYIQHSKIKPDFLRHTQDGETRGIAEILNAWQSFSTNPALAALKSNDAEYFRELIKAGREFTIENAKSALSYELKPASIEALLDVMESKGMKFDTSAQSDYARYPLIQLLNDLSPSRTVGDNGKFSSYITSSDSLALALDFNSSKYYNKLHPDTFSKFIDIKNCYGKAIIQGNSKAVIDMINKDNSILHCKSGFQNYYSTEQALLGTALNSPILFSFAHGNFLTAFALMYMILKIDTPKLAQETEKGISTMVEKVRSCLPAGNRVEKNSL